MKVLPINPRSSSRQNPGLLRSGKAVHPSFPGMGWGGGRARRFVSPPPRRPSLSSPSMESGLAGVFGPCRGSEGEARLGPRGRVGKEHGVPASKTAGGPPRPEACAPPLRAWDGAAARRKKEAARMKSPPERSCHGPARPRPTGREPRPHSRAPPDWPCAPRSPSCAPPGPRGGAKRRAGRPQDCRPGSTLPPRRAPRPGLAPLLLCREQITSQEIAERSGESKARQICLHPENRLSV